VFQNSVFSGWRPYCLTWYYRHCRQFLTCHMDVLQSEGFQLAKMAYASFSKMMPTSDGISKKVTSLKGCPSLLLILIVCTACPAT